MRTITGKIRECELLPERCRPVCSSLSVDGQVSHGISISNLDAKASNDDVKDKCDPVTAYDAHVAADFLPPA